MVVDPVTITPSTPLRQALEIMHACGFSGLPVVQARRPVGILTSRDLRFETNLDQAVGGVMTRDPITVPQGIALEEARHLLHKHRIEKLLVVDPSGELKGLITVKDILNAQSHPHAVKDSAGRLRVGAAVGIGPDLEAASRRSSRRARRRHRRRHGARPLEGRPRRRPRAARRLTRTCS
jgi:IMP dehydrogenase